MEASNSDNIDRRLKFGTEEKSHLKEVVHLGGFPVCHKRGNAQWESSFTCSKQVIIHTRKHFSIISPKNGYYTHNENTMCRN